MGWVMGGLLMASLGVTAALPSVESVPAVDAQRYAGTWYEVARLPNRFQDKCSGDVTASYRPLPDGAIEVVNRCRQADNTWDEVEGRAVPADNSGSGARLKVSFLPSWLRWLPVGRGDYWVVKLDADYRYAIVSEPQRKYLWILSRTPVMNAVTYEELIGWLREHGYPTDNLVRTPHRASPEALTTPRLMV